MDTTDRAQRLRFGLSLDPDAGRLPETLELAAAADAAGLDLLALQDHPYQPGHLDALTLSALVAARTSRISVFTDVADLRLRPPVMLAKTAASLSAASGGRFQLGVGGGGIPEAIGSMGAAPMPPREVVAYTEESLRIMRTALDGGPVRHRGDVLTVPGYQAGPVPPRRVELWLGGQRPRMLAVAGRAADGWISPLNIYVPPQEVPERQRVVDEAARAAGRDPARVRRIYNVIGVIGGSGAPGLNGDVGRWADTLAEWATVLRFDTFVFWPVTAHRQQLEVFAGEVVPAVRERVAR
ncbi:LLM class flavin-dependent oxidoreductase [Streptomyces sp. NBC_00510]|uniref:LLM class flavin-dependent oxidoreductase n=1 Tax=Actinacidiphila glaucinigra TaxID=235986 RepID=UPI002DD82F40|nr:LLM class flavin-dependent oxidoreductase [Actinacidiphila glaucinigra]WSD60837.1 LLM class flavin-dependent oxidoreductase [Actinacidiphila glaucinigra]